MIEKKKTFTRRELLWFGPLFVMFAGVLGSVVMRRFEAPAAAASIWWGAAGLVAVYYLVPAWRRPIFAAWLASVYPLGWLLSHVLLGIVFYAVVLPTGLLLRALHHDPLRRRFDREAESYWIERQPTSDPQRYFRQF